MQLKLYEYNLDDLLKAYSAPAVAPAGVSGSALTAAVGAALIVKVARITERKLPSGADRERVASAAERVERTRNMLRDIVLQDAEAYSKLVRAKTLYAKGEETQENVQLAIKTATLIPGAMGRAAMICINLAADIVDVAYAPATSDLAMGSLLLSSAVEAHLLAVRHNLDEITDEAFRAKILSKHDFFDARAATLQRILDTVKQKNRSKSQGLGSGL